MSCPRQVASAGQGCKERAIACPLLALWGGTGPLARADVLDTWRAWAHDVRGTALPCGHHLPEEAPQETYAALRDFLAAAR